MSFIIATIYDNFELFAASDTQITGSAGNIMEAKKIIPLSETASIAYSGGFEIANAIATSFRDRYDEAWGIDIHIEGLKSISMAFDEAYTKRFKAHPECVFMLSSLTPKGPHISLLTLSEGMVQVFQEPLQSGKYQFFFANPTDYSFEDCMKLCRLKLLIAGSTPCGDVLRDLIGTVSSRSSLVSEDSFVWQARTAKV